jgi:hypothetical protein
MKFAIQIRLGFTKNDVSMYVTVITYWANVRRIV